MTTRSCMTLTLAGFLVAGMFGCAADKTPPSGVVSADAVSATARVQSLDLVTRHIVLRRSDGEMLRFRVGDEVRNLSQVKIGDDVKVTYSESLTWTVKKPGEAAPGAALTEGVDRADPGQRPGAVSARSLAVTATIAAIDKNAKTVTLRWPAGTMNTYKARDPKNLDRVSVGDLVEITYTEGLAVSVEAVPR